MSYISSLGQLYYNPILIVRPLNVSVVAGLESKPNEQSHGVRASASVTCRWTPRSCFAFDFGIVAVVASLIFTLYMPLAVHAQSLAPAPAPTSDGMSIDQGIAYVLMMLALALTYQKTTNALSDLPNQFIGEDFKEFKLKLGG
ncbi:Arabinogalactan peptide 16 [Spatholobus suberectus]|nr:Arabinogalactan peptide 16 [Spatholobus suberectus]